MLMGMSPLFGPGGGVVGVLCAGQVELPPVSVLEESFGVVFRKMRHLVMHELHSPLHGICGLAADLAAEESPMKKPLLMISHSVRWISELVTNMMDYWDIEAEVELAKDALTVDALVKEAIQQCERAVGKQGTPLRHEGVKIEQVVGEGLPPVKGDAPSLVKMFRHVFSNAIRFTNKGTVRIIVSLERVEGAQGISVTVKDTGIGTSPMHRQRIFEPFQQEDSSASKLYDGLGLGLTIARGVAMRHNGFCHLEHSTKGQGSTFCIWLPCRAPKEQAGTAEQLTLPEPIVTQQQFRQREREQQERQPLEQQQQEEEEDEEELRSKPHRKQEHLPLRCCPVAEIPDASPFSTRRGSRVWIAPDDHQEQASSPCLLPYASLPVPIPGSAVPPGNSEVVAHLAAVPARIASLSPIVPPSTFAPPAAIASFTKVAPLASAAPPATITPPATIAPPATTQSDMALAPNPFQRAQLAGDVRIQRFGPGPGSLAPDSSSNLVGTSGFDPAQRGEFGSAYSAYPFQTGAGPWSGSARSSLGYASAPHLSCIGGIASPHLAELEQALSSGNSKGEFLQHSLLAYPPGSCSHFHIPTYW